MRIKTGLALATLPVLFSIAPANATTFTFEGHNLPGNQSAGKNSHIKTTFDDNTDILTWSSTYTYDPSSTTALADGAWLVLSDGENPKNNADEYAIFYLDGINEKVSIYNYDGANSANSYKYEHFLGSEALTVTNNGYDRTFEFSIDMSDINNDTAGLFDDTTWKGAAFDENIGIWFHGAGNLTTQYNNNNSNDGLHTFTYTNQSWYDTANQTATAVPEPGSMAALGLFALAAVGKLRKRSSDALGE
ncbi:MAG: PEP-CTERM sorting domain-containing protein [Cyanobacteria bacterium J06621_3]